MSATEIIIFCLILIPFIVIALLLLNGKAAFLIAGYNTMSDDKKAQYDKKALCRFTGWIVLAFCLGMILWVMGFYFDITWFSNTILVVTLAGPLAAAIYANTGNRFRNKADLETQDIDVNVESKSTSAKKTVIISVAFSAIILVAVGVMLCLGELEPQISIQNSSIEISSIYGLNVDFSEITKIDLIENDISVIGAGTRTNGYGGFGGTLKGNFKTSANGEVLLFVRKTASPTIHIERNGMKDIFINYRDSKTTRMLYGEIEQGFY